MLAPLRSRPYIPVAMVARRPVTAATVAAAAPGVDFSGSLRRHRDGMLVQDSAEGSVLQIFGGEVFVCPQNAVIGREELGSFCNLSARGEGRCYLHEINRECEAESGVRLERLELAQGAKEGSLDAGVMARETVELGGGSLVC